MDNTFKYYQQIFHLKNAEFICIDHSDTIIAAVYKVIIPHQKPLILKLCTKEKHFYREVLFLDKLKEILPIPPLLDSVTPSKTHRGALLMPFIEGHIPKADDFSDALAYEVGQTLGRLHTHRTDGYGDLTKPENLTQDVATDFEEKFYEELDECAAELSQSFIANCKAFLKDHHARLEQVDGPCITHSDFRPGNMLVKEGKLQVLLDWSSCKAGFAEQDFTILHHREWLHTRDLKEAFLKGYSSERCVPDYASVMPLLQLGRALGIVGWCLKVGMSTDDHKALYTFNKRYLDAFNFQL